MCLREPGEKKSETSIGRERETKMREKKKHLDDEVSGWEKTRQREKDKK